MRWWWRSAAIDAPTRPARAALSLLLLLVLVSTAAAAAESPSAPRPHVVAAADVLSTNGAREVAARPRLGAVRPTGLGHRNEPRTTPRWLDRRRGGLAPVRAPDARRAAR